jgi:hypothetical protein
MGRRVSVTWGWDLTWEVEVDGYQISVIRYREAAISDWEAEKDNAETLSTLRSAEEEKSSHRGHGDRDAEDAESLGVKSKRVKEREKRRIHRPDGVGAGTGSRGTGEGSERKGSGRRTVTERRGE